MGQPGRDDVEAGEVVPRGGCQQVPEKAPALDQTPALRHFPVAAPMLWNHDRRNGE
jgi:hypothetical protein